MRVKATLAQIAAFTGFSTATVSRAFAHPDLVNQETLDAIMEASEILGYNLPSGVKQVQKHRVGVFVDLFQNDGGIEILRGIANTLRSRRFELVLFESLDALDELLEVRKVAARQDLSAIIFIGRPKNEDSATVLQNGDLPVVFIDHRPTNFSQVSSPIDVAVKLALDFFATTNVSKLMFVGHLPASTDAKEALLLSSLHQESRNRKKFECSEYLIDARQSPGPINVMNAVETRKPDAIFASSDYLAAQVYRDCLNIGYQVGKDLQILGYGDMDIAEALNLSSVRTFLDAQGRRAAEIVYSRLMETPEGSKTFVEMIEPRLVLRQSTAPEGMK